MVPTGQTYSDHVPEVIGAVMAEQARSATKYVTDKYVVKATRSNRWSLRKNARNVTILVTFGSPNYAEREFIKQCAKAHEPFPVKKVQLRFYPTTPLKRASKAEAIARRMKKGYKPTRTEVRILAAATLPRLR